MPAARDMPLLLSDELIFPAIEKQLQDIVKNILRFGEKTWPLSPSIWQLMDTDTRERTMRFLLSLIWSEVFTTDFHQLLSIAYLSHDINYFLLSTMESRDYQLNPEDRQFLTKKIDEQDIYVKKANITVDEFRLMPRE
jgi:hypothetical protein